MRRFGAQGDRQLDSRLMAAGSSWLYTFLAMAALLQPMHVSIVASTCTAASMQPALELDHCLQEAHGMLHNDAQHCLCKPCQRTWIVGDRRGRLSRCCTAGPPCAVGDGRNRPVTCTHTTQES